MELDRQHAVAFLVAVIGGLFSFLTYIEHSVGMGVFGIWVVGWIWWVCGRSETEM